MLRRYKITLNVLGGELKINKNRLINIDNPDKRKILIRRNKALKNIINYLSPLDSKLKLKN